MVRIAQLASYDLNIGDNIAIYNIRRVLTSLIDEPIEWTNVHLSQFHNIKNNVLTSCEILKSISDNNDMLIIGGGGLIEGGQGHLGTSWLYGTNWKLPFDETTLSEIDIPIVCFALGINYFRNWPKISNIGQENIRHLVDKSALFSLRNDGSIDLFREFSDQAAEEIPDAGLVFADHLQIPRKTEIKTGFLQTCWNNKEELVNGRGLGDENLLHLVATMKENNLANFAHCTKDYCFPYNTAVISEKDFTERVKYDRFMSIVGAYALFDYSVAMRGHGQMIALGVNLPSIYFSTQDKVRDFSYRNGLEDYNVDIEDPEWHAKLNEKIYRLKTDKEYLQNWYEIRDKTRAKYTKDFYDFCHKIKDLL